MNGKRLVAVGYLSHKLDEIVVLCDDDFADTWYTGVVNSMDAPVHVPRLLTEHEMAAELEALRDGMDDEEWHSRGMW